MQAEIVLTTVRNIADLHDYLNAELRLRHVDKTPEALRSALENPAVEAEIEFVDYGKISGDLFDYVNQLIEAIVLAAEKNPRVNVSITM